MLRSRFDLIAAWLGARSIGRGLPLPVSDHGGLRVDTGTPAENRRYVFADPLEGLRELAHSIEAPRVALKLAGAREEMIPLLTARWRISEPNFMMIRERLPDPDAVHPNGYRLELSTSQATTTARFLTAGGDLAASGHAIEFDGVFAYDRIVTEPAHQRRGLGRAVMATLSRARRSAASMPILVATAEGRALYLALGWTPYSPWTTALIPDPAP